MQGHGLRVPNIVTVHANQSKQFVWPKNKMVTAYLAVFETQTRHRFKPQLKKKSAIQN
jgi:hypothetical protein